MGVLLFFSRATGKPARAGDLIADTEATSRARLRSKVPFAARAHKDV
jgi:hypothetical protein